MDGHAEGAKRTGGGAPSGGAYRLSDSPAHLLRRSQQFASEIFVRAGFADGVTLRQTVVLAAVAERDGSSQSDLVRATGVDRSTLADMIARMEKRGLVSRASSSADGRAKSVRLTDTGRKRLAGALPALRMVDETLMAALPKTKRKGLRSTLSALADAADNAEAMERAEHKRLKRLEKARKAEAKARSAKGKRGKKK
jgi:DNA-binding MarR family transcriptional regulator